MIISVTCSSVIISTAGTVVGYLYSRICLCSTG